MESKSKINSLLVLNQNVPLGHIRKLLVRTKKNVILSTHLFFDFEREEIATEDCDIEFYTYADFLTDQEMQEIDDRATELLFDIRGSSKYALKHMSLSKKLKNQIVFDKVLSKYDVERIHCVNGLGIDYSIWQKANAKRIAKFWLPELVLSFLGKTKRLIQRIFLSSTEFYLLRNKGKVYVFLSTIKRLKFCDEISIEKLSLGNMYLFLRRIFTLSFADARVPFLKSVLKKIKDEGLKPILSTSIHQYCHDVELINSFSNLELNIFVDGFHPSNYPRTYLDSFAKGKFIVQNYLNAAWFKLNGFDVDLLPGIIKSDSFNSEIRFAESTVKRVVLLLNHAGDWTALINRSDTDRLIVAFCALAKDYIDIEFVVRPHPTMTHVDHEGLYSRERIETYVSKQQRSNLKVSNSSLEEDLSSGDVFVSEYSQVLIDTFALGKIGIILNLSSRRNFMEDYAKLGFLHCDSDENFKSLMAGVIDKPIEYMKEQQKAINLFNDNMQNYSISE